MDNVRIAANKIDFLKIVLKYFRHKHQRMMIDIHVVRPSFILIKNLGFQNRLPNPSCESCCNVIDHFVLFFNFPLSLDR